MFCCVLTNIGLEECFTELVSELGVARSIQEIGDLAGKRSLLDI